MRSRIVASRYYGAARARVVAGSVMTNMTA